MRFTFNINNYFIDLNITENDKYYFHRFGSIISISIPFKIPKEVLAYKLNCLIVSMIYEKEFGERDNEFDVDEYIEIMGANLETANVFSKKLYNEICKYIYSYEIEHEYR